MSVIHTPASMELLVLRIQMVQVHVTAVLAILGHSVKLTSTSACRRHVIMVESVWMLSMDLNVFAQRVFQDQHARLAWAPVQALLVTAQRHVLTKPMVMNVYALLDTLGWIVIVTSMIAAVWILVEMEAHVWTGSMDTSVTAGKIWHNNYYVKKKKRKRNGKAVLVIAKISWGKGIPISQTQDFFKPEVISLPTV